MGNLFGKDGPLLKFSCIHVASGSNDIHITCTDGADKRKKEQEEEKEKIKKTVFSCFSKRIKKNGRKEGENKFEEE